MLPTASPIVRRPVSSRAFPFTGAACVIIKGRVIEIRRKQHLKKKQMIQNMQSHPPTSSRSGGPSSLGGEVLLSGRKKES